MRYRIHFINGEVAGSVFDIPANGTLSVGRSRSNSVCLKAPDVSGRHLVLTASENGVTLESLSLRKTETESGRVEIGVKIPLAAGQTVKIGSSNEFVLECAELRGDTVEDIAPASEPNPAPRNFDENATIGGGAFPGGMDNKTVVVSEDFGNTVLSSTPENPPMQPGAFGGGKTSVAADSSGSRGEPAALERDMPGEDASIAYNNTVALQTRMASPDELEFMRVAYQKKRTKKTLIMSAAVTLSFALVFFVYFAFFHREPERYLSWPKNANGNYAIGRVDVPVPFGNDMDFQFPSAGNAKVSESENLFVVETRIGKYSDVPLRVVLSFEKNGDFLKIDRRRAFEDWMNEKKSGDGNWNFDLIQPISFYGSFNGIPYLAANYSYVANSESYFGIAEFFRIEDWRFVLRKEIPMRERWRGESFIKNETMVFFANSLVFRAWEGFENPKSENPKASVEEAKRLLSRDSPAVWDKTDYLLKNALAVSLMNGDMDTFSAAQALLVSLRESQAVWYNAQKISYNLAAVRKDEKAARRVSENCKAVFSSDEDLRFHLIRQNKWN